MTEHSFSVSIRQGDLTDAYDAAAIRELLNHYAQHPMGQSEPLNPAILDRVVPAMAQHPTSVVFLADRKNVDSGESMCVGMATCFVGFSTFKASQLINVHDLVVHESARGQGVGGQLLDAVIDYAESERFCAVTLEVQADNSAQVLYQRKGFRGINESLASETFYFGKRSLTAANEGKN